MVHIKYMGSGAIYLKEEWALCTRQPPAEGSKVVTGTYFYMFPKTDRCEACDRRHKSGVPH